ncbi:hypothetical protein JR316_0005692 [Psilocybe cubensis]|uniref:Uncharacterized protein n=2 Tax=Psilocybe cubensis TaxID=181762 RepID=A0ACB8H0I1_PSICU|nr:hypothetical protein JR316_0005692 [Psilocybe cubensis]KAH9481172.1 hypothetical protein JR316_0005692 [Psilocybe cubensis]
MSFPVPIMVAGNNYTFRVAYKDNPGLPTPHYEIAMRKNDDKVCTCYFPQELIESDQDIVFDIRGPDSSSWVYIFDTNNQLFVSSSIKSMGRLSDYLVHRVDMAKPSPRTFVDRNLEYGKWKTLDVIVLPCDHPLGGTVINSMYDIETDTYVAKFRMYLLSYDTLIKTGIAR